MGCWMMGLRSVLSQGSRDTAGPAGGEMCRERPDLGLGYSLYTKIVQWFKKKSDGLSLTLGSATCWLCDMDSYCSLCAQVSSSVK